MSTEEWDAKIGLDPSSTPVVSGGFRGAPGSDVLRNHSQGRDARRFSRPSHARVCGFSGGVSAHRAGGGPKDARRWRLVSGTDGRSFLVRDDHKGPRGQHAGWGPGKGYRRTGRRVPSGGTCHDGRVSDTVRPGFRHPSQAPVTSGLGGKKVPQSGPPRPSPSDFCPPPSYAGGATESKRTVRADRLHRLFLGLLLTSCDRDSRDDEDVSEFLSEEGGRRGIRDLRRGPGGSGCRSVRRLVAGPRRLGPKHRSGPEAGVGHASHVYVLPGRTAINITSVRRFLCDPDP